MAVDGNRETVEGFWKALEAKELEAATGFLHEGFIEEGPSPESGSAGRRTGWG